MHDQHMAYGMPKRLVEIRIAKAKRAFNMPLSLFLITSSEECSTWHQDFPHVETALVLLDRDLAVGLDVELFSELDI